MLEINLDHIEQIVIESPFFSKFSDRKELCSKLIDLITDFPEIFNSLEEHAREKLKVIIKNDENLIIKSYFLSSSVAEHFKNLSQRYHIEEETFSYTKYYISHVFRSAEIKFLWNLANVKGCKYEFNNLMITHYKHSTDFNTAEYIFDHCIGPNLFEFDERQIVSLLEAVNSNRQIHDTRRRFFSSEIKSIKNQANELLGPEYPYEENFPDISFL